MEMHMQHCMLQMVLLLCSVTDRGMGDTIRYEDVPLYITNDTVMVGRIEQIVRLRCMCNWCTSQMTLSQLVEWEKWFNVELCVWRCTVAHHKLYYIMAGRTATIEQVHIC